ncbi:MAG: anhydro-N-acetylmuramic acid kinase [Balneola sp.]|nr:anhydro-N-acetylmuramic acid kinase [Balneola sp.]
MNKRFKQIYELSGKPIRRVIGLMSGTSLDGLDIAYCHCSEQRLEVKEYLTVPYDEKIRSLLVSVQSKEQVPLGSLCILNTKLAHSYAAFIRMALQKWNLSHEDVDFIGSHGQTVFHFPTKERTATLQIVDGDQLAVASGLPVVSDFRQKHTAVGGEGAPLVSLMDEALFRDAKIARMLLNLGGIANLSWLPSITSGSEVVSSDTGPANTLINEAMTLYFGKEYDKNGEVARQGQVNNEFVKALLCDDFFKKKFPKSTGQEIFNLDYIHHQMQSLGVYLQPKDLVATLTQFTVESVALAMKKISNTVSFEWYVSGGGLYNTMIMDGLRAYFPNFPQRKFDELGIPPDAKEAALIAFLADGMIVGKKFLVNNREVSLGKLSLSD